MPAPCWLCQKAAPARDVTGVSGQLLSKPLPWGGGAGSPVTLLFELDGVLNRCLEPGVTLDFPRSSPSQAPSRGPKSALVWGWQGPCSPSPGLAATFHLDVQNLREARPPS